LTVRGPLSQEQRERLLEIAGRCPVYKTLKGEINVQSTLVPTSEGDAS
jgi:putative redox protein